jgi:hypothetical protein
MVKALHDDRATRSRLVFHLGNPRVFVWIFLFLAGLGVLGITQAQLIRASVLQDHQVLVENSAGQFSFVLTSLRKFDISLAEAKSQGVDVSTIEAMRPQVITQLQSGAYVAAAENLVNLAHQLQALRDAKQVADQAIIDAARPSVIEGVIKTSSGKILTQVLVELRTDTVITQATSDASGRYHIEALTGTYSLKATKSGYVASEQANLKLVAGGSQTIDIVLTAVSPSGTSSSAKSTTTTKNTSATTSSSTTSDSTSNSTYDHRTIGTDRGDFTADIMTFDLVAGARVRTATGNDDDCADNCVVKSLMSYVNEEGGNSGINGTYFCPPDYGASCSGQVNSYFWKFYKTSAGKLINGTNELGNLDPMLAFTSSGQAQYFRTWDSWKNSGFATYAGINSKPRLVEGGANVLSDGDLDDKQRTTKSNRGALGLKGQTFYAVIVRSATVPDLAAVMSALGVDNAMNIDGGGSSAMVYRGSYKVGPGRAIPNAVVIVH